MHRKKRFLPGVITLVSLLTILSLIPANAADNATLSEININPLNGGTYQIVVKTDKAIPIEKTVSGNNQLILNLKNTKPARFVNTIYNTANIEHVIVEPVSNDQVKVSLQGTNISASDVSLDVVKDFSNFGNQQNIPVAANSNIQNNQANTLPTANRTQPKETEIIYLSKPVDNYKPVITYENDDLMVEDDAEAIHQNMLNVTFSKIFNKSNLDWLIRFAAIVLLFIAGLKLFKPKDKKVTIDLSNDNLRTREIDLFKSLNEKRGLAGIGLSNSTPKFDKITRKPGYSSISRYGINEYRNSNVSPYNTPSPMMRNELKPMRTPLKTGIPSRQTSIPQRSPLNTSKINKNDINTAKINVDGMRFLESMAKIYEKSGRTDLAQGLQENIIKAKMTNNPVPRSMRG